MRRTIGSGLVLGLLYLATASLTFKAGVLPVRPFFDGNHGAPYGWVDAPRGVPDPPVAQPVSKVVPLERRGVVNDSVQTGEAVLYIPENTVLPSEGETGVRFSIQPLDPNEVGEPPEGRTYNGNAFRVEIKYEPSGEQAKFLAKDECADLTVDDIQTCIQLGLRYPFTMPGIEMYKRSGPDWTPVVGDDQVVTTEYYADLPDPTGVYVITGVGPLPGLPDSRTSDYIAIGLGVLAVALGVSVARARNDRKRKEMIARARGKKMKRPADKPKARGAR